MRAAYVYTIWVSSSSLCGVGHYRLWVVDGQDRGPGWVTGFGLAVVGRCGDLSSELALLPELR